MFYLFELSQDWVSGVNGATCKSLGAIEAADLKAACEDAARRYPDRHLRVCGMDFAVEIQPGVTDFSELVEVIL